MSEQRSVSPPPSRIGPTEPDDTMVICPVCTSQFRAIPLDVQRERDELQQSFDLHWRASMRAIKRWQEAHPGSDLTWPDHADLVVWLLEQLDAASGVIPGGDEPDDDGRALTGGARGF